MMGVDVETAITKIISLGVGAGASVYSARLAEEGMFYPNPGK